MPNLISLHVVYDSAGLLTGLNDIDLVCSISPPENKQISSAVYDISVSPPVKVSNPINGNTKILVKIEDCDGSYYLVSDSYGKISDAMGADCEFCVSQPFGEEPETDPIFSASPAHDITSGHITFLNTKDYNSLNNRPDLSLKADLVGGKVPASQLPSYVDDVLEFADLSSFPNPGEEGKIYVALDTNRIYRWSGSAYIEVSPDTDHLTQRSVIQNVTYTQDSTNYYIKGQVLHLAKDQTAINFAPGNLSFYLNGTLQTGTGILIDREVSPTPLLSNMTSLRDMNGDVATVGYAFIPFIITIPKSTNTAALYSNGNGYISFVLSYTSFNPDNLISTPMYVMRAVFTDSVPYLPLAGGNMTGAIHFPATYLVPVSLTRDFAGVAGTSGWARDFTQVIDNTGAIDSFGHYGSYHNGVVDILVGYMGGKTYLTKNALKWDSNQAVIIGSTGISGTSLPTAGYALDIVGNELVRGNVDFTGNVNTTSGDLLLQRLGVTALRANAADTILSGNVPTGIIYLRPQGDTASAGQVIINPNNTQFVTAYNLLFGAQTISGASLFHTDIPADSVRGYGLWMGQNLQFNGTDFIQPRGDLPSYGFTVNNHKKFSFNRGSSTGVSGNVVTLTELVSINDTGVITTLNTGNSTQWNNKQDALVSGTNLKTVNSNSLLGSGNINIPVPPVQFGTSYTKEWNGSVTTATNTAVFNISSASFSSISNISVATELIGASVNNAPIGVITARSLTSITVSLYESKNTGVLIGGNIEGLEDHSVTNTVVYLTVKGN
ncbi:autotransporter outer membrane beta-barrel domain-containing protein [Chryseobacterium potabilaquae]|uniref:Uncharacterized protein n=1 Tax=Chryseobacterium potabilaquae TaxID=2675057 RepID=A0A6N4XDW3_9FLAO|nr:hypothetical protein [Chryseobacterium potabilaquae]CAA7196803.1 hypothetical protein CHRY9293_02875 [Chryseobacterium potabilaquae]